MSLVLSNLYPFLPFEPEGSARTVHTNSNTLEIRRCRKGSHPWFPLFSEPRALFTPAENPGSMLYRAGRYHSACWEAGYTQGCVPGHIPRGCVPGHIPRGVHTQLGPTGVYTQLGPTGVINPA